jgi:hypothetical protein
MLRQQQQTVNHDETLEPALVLHHHPKPYTSAPYQIGLMAPFATHSHLIGDGRFSQTSTPLMPVGILKRSKD